MNYEYVDQRILGAFALVDAATGQRIARPMQVEAATGRVVRNTSSFYVVVSAPGLADYTLEYDPPDTPVPASIPFAVTVRDPQKQYLPRQVTLDLPRDPDRANADNVFQPQQAMLFPSPAAPLMANWSVIRASVAAEDTDDPLAGALILILQNGAIIGRGLSDSRGEALVAVSGIPVTTWDNGDEDEADGGPPGGGPGRGRGRGGDDDDEPPLVLVSEIAVTLQTVFDPAAAGLPDPEDLEARRAGLPTSEQSLSLAAGRHESVSITISIA